MTDPFDLNDAGAYATWREKKLENYPASVDALSVAVDDPSNPSSGEIDSLQALCRKTNVAIYKSNVEYRRDRSIPTSLGVHLGLTRPDKSLTTDDDGVTELQVAKEGERSAYIPY